MRPERLIDAAFVASILLLVVVLSGCAGDRMRHYQSPLCGELPRMCQ